MGREQQKNLIDNAYPSIAEKIIITGNPRIDLLRNEFQIQYTNSVKDLLSKYGKFILINSSFAVTSLKEGFSEYLRKIKSIGYLK